MEEVLVKAVVWALQNEESLGGPRKLRVGWSVVLFGDERL